ncbi:hypothetical protein G3554_13255 [Micromonospora sp. PPF5-17]|uniref:Lycopene cyclase domain-containing protein n=1 Tax=Micromonospora solifontis TaxID=2487138 RepID=A0ABX9WFU4_9ACTN|nr:hypothetical protein [Micromonospora sp. PPF5-17B]NES37123.1 hypothetical protein [Micromonospora solifontis]NES54092.1 hypothetical protein [Micromonospora sp. PPF5-6]RNL98716.1 hypothetical protein EFE23_13285 [Micromonospora solifontis]
MTRRLAGWLLRAAVRRWPAELRDELSREWVAELHVLAGRGERWRMLRFAASLATSRSGAPVVDRVRFDARARRTAATLLLAPLVCLAIPLAAGLLVNLVLSRFATAHWLIDAQPSGLALLTAGLAVLLARLAHRSAARGTRTGPVRTALGIVLPVGLTAVGAEYALNETTDDLVRVAPALLVWLPGLTLVLHRVGVLAGRGRTRAAWWVGGLGAFVVADLAVALMVVANISGSPETVIDGVAQGDAIDRISAPLWLFTSLTDWSFGLPRPTPSEIFLISDLVELQPFLYLACTPYALTYAIGAARPAEPVGVRTPEPAPSPA